MDDHELEKKLSIIFALEANTRINAVATGLINLQGKLDNSSRQVIIETAFRDIHSLKGAAQVVKRKDVIALTQPLEGLLDLLRSKRLMLTGDILDLLCKAVHGLEQLLSVDTQLPSSDQEVSVEQVIHMLHDVLKVRPDGNS